MKIDINGFRKMIKTYGSIYNIPTDLLSKLTNKVLKKLSEKETKEFVDVCVDYWHKKGYPFSEMTMKEMEKEYKKIVSFNVNKISTGKNGKEIGQNFTGLEMVNSFHPQRHSVQCRNFFTPMDNFNNEKRLRKVIRKVIQISGNPLIKSNFRSIIKLYSGTHLASNFRPTAAKYVYEKYCPAGGKVLDPSLGFSGRLFGALSSHIGHYEGCDPCKETFDHGVEFYNTIKKINNSGSKLSKFLDIECRKLPNIVMHNIPFEDYIPEPETFDLVFTSPPYFNVEKYSDEENQSWKKYSTYDLWLEKFLYPSVDICYTALKKGGIMIYNIAGKKPPIEKDYVKYAIEKFGKIDDTIYLQLTKMFGIKYKGKTDMNSRVDHKLEPMFIFKK